MIASRVLVSLIGIGALAIVIFAPRVTHADSVDQSPSEVVRFGDLNLDTRAGVERLFGRIRIAAAAVCQEYGPRGTLVPSAAHRSCMRKAVSGAVGSLDSPLLKAYYNERERHAAVTIASR